MGAGAGLAGLDRIHQRVVATRSRQTGITAHTLELDASQTCCARSPHLVAEKEAAHFTYHFTYKGETGYMPMVGHLAESGVVIHAEFREGNIAPATQNLEFIKACEARLPLGHTITQVRIDAAAYQAGIFNHCEDTGKTARHWRTAGRADAGHPCGHSRLSLEDPR